MDYECVECGDTTQRGSVCERCEFWAVVELEIGGEETFLMETPNGTACYSVNPPELNPRDRTLLGHSGRVMVAYDPTSACFVVSNNWWNRGYIDEFWKSRFLEQGCHTLVFIDTPETTAHFEGWAAHIKDQHTAVTYDQILPFYQRADEIWENAKKTGQPFFLCSMGEGSVEKFKKQCFKLGVATE